MPRISAPPSLCPTPAPQEHPPGSHRPPSPVPLPREPDRGQPSPASAGALSGSRRHGGGEARLPPQLPFPVLPPSRCPGRAEPRGRPTCERVRGAGRRAAAGARRRRPPARRKVPPLCAVSPPPRTSSPARSGWKSPAKPAALPAPPHTPRGGAGRAAQRAGGSWGPGLPRRLPRLHLMPPLPTPPPAFAAAGTAWGERTPHSPPGRRSPSRPAPAGPSQAAKGGAGWSVRSRRVPLGAGWEGAGDRCRCSPRRCCGSA